MNGHAYQSPLPESWSPKGENVLWEKKEYATRGTPVVMNDKIYVVCRAFPETTKEGEKTVCLNAKSGEMIWESIHNVYLSDAPAERVSWTSPVADPESNQVYVLGVGGTFQCLDGDTGEVKWEHAMLEEYGMISPYGGRTNLPTLFEDMVYVSAVMTGWGESAIPAHRYVAFDKSTGMAAWMYTTVPKPEDTTYSTPIFTTFNGQAAMVFGAADGAVYALQPRTGKMIWKYQASPRGINTTPLIDENGIVYCGHAEQNESDRTRLGAIFAIDGKMTGVIKEDQLVWKIPGITVSRAGPVKLDERVYFVDDGATMHVINAADGKEIAEKKLGRIMFNSPLVGDGKIYVAEQTGRVYILTPDDKKGVKAISTERVNDYGEFYASPIAHDGRIYLSSNVSMICIGPEEPAAEMSKLYTTLPSMPMETSVKKDTKVAHIQIAPVELLLTPGQTQRMQVRAYNANGQFLKLLPDAKITVDNGVFSDGTFVAPKTEQSLPCMITATVNDLTSTARARVIPSLPIMVDFNDGKVPVTWIGAAYRHQPTEVDGEKMLVKVSTIPKGTRSQSWFARPNMHDYTVQADFYATDMRGKDQTDRLPDMGLVAQRYTLDMKGSQELQIRSWTPRLQARFAKTVPFEWTPLTWYTMKFQSETLGEATTLRGKVWPRDGQEPAQWQIEATDDVGNLQGSPGFFGKSDECQFFIDNVKVIANER